jgi:topoisomerase IV subunit A
MIGRASAKLSRLWVQVSQRLLYGIVPLVVSVRNSGRRSATRSRRSGTTFGPKTPLGKRRSTFAQAPAHDEAAIEEAMVIREPITVVVAQKGWIRALKGTVTDLTGVTFKGDDGLRFAFPAETTSKCLMLATNGRFYTIEAGKLPGGRGHGEPVRLFVDIEQESDPVSVFPAVGGRKFLVASREGRGFIVPEDECIANTRKGKILNSPCPMRPAP